MMDRHAMDQVLRAADALAVAKANGVNVRNAENTLKNLMWTHHDGIVDVLLNAGRDADALRKQVEDLNQQLDWYEQQMTQQTTAEEPQETATAPEEKPAKKKK